MKITATISEATAKKLNIPRAPVSAEANIPETLPELVKAFGEDVVAGAAIDALVISAQAFGPYLEDFQQFHRARMPNNRHSNKSLNVLCADGHAETIRPIAFDPSDIPLKYAPRIRVSPYPPGCD